jgi:tetratricopeptide (TPR) repeat protein
VEEEEQVVMKWQRLTWIVLGFVASISAETASAQVRGQRLPSPDYFATFRPYIEGDFVTAGKGFESASRMRAPGGVWIDSIPLHTMCGESLYHMGKLKAALDQYETALQIFLSYSDWLGRVELPAALQPNPRAGRRPPAWGTPTRPVRVALIPNFMPSLQGRSDAENQQILQQQGGVISLPHYRMISVREIHRCTALAIQRRSQIIGATAQYDRLTSSLITALARRPAPAGHWIQAWISCQLGIAQAASGKIDEAVMELNKSLLVGGMDHPLTPMALLELGKLAFRAKEYEAAGAYFLDATFSAAMQSQDDYTQYLIIGEAFRWGMVNHLASGKRSMYPPLIPAAAWANRESNYLQASILVTAAANAAAIFDAKQAGALLDQARRSMRPREFQRTSLRARANYVLAQVGFQTGDHAAGLAALSDAMKFATVGSEWVFQIGLADRLFTSGNVTARQAGTLYAETLRDPLPEDWLRDPWESLAVLMIPHEPAYEHWMLLALDRKEHDNAMRISDSLRRHRFYSSLPLGGRVLNLRWMFEAPASALTADAALQRQDLLNRYPKFSEMSKTAAALRTELAKVPPVSDDAEQNQRQGEMLASLAEVSATQENFLGALALGHDASQPVFPPRIDITLIQQNLQPGQRILAFAATRKQLFAFLLGEEKYSSWVIESPVKVRANINAMLRAMGLHDRTQPISYKELANTEWKEPAAELLQQLTGNAPAETWDQFEELIVVPDGMIWYLPFEALQIKVEDKYVSLIDKVRIRYVPTLSLTIPDPRPRKRLARTAVVAGRLFPKNDESAALATLATMQAEDPEVIRVPNKPVPPSALFTSTIDRLVVFSDLDNDAGGPYSWAPMDVDRGKPASDLASWMALPWGAPDELILPGFHTSAENGLKRAAAGHEVFLTVCGLMATGSRTILMSRWRDGGATSFGLVREFVRELPHRSASEAWQRSVRLAIDSELDILAEPRVKPPPTEMHVKASHPFFWSGYMLIDTGVQVETE